MNITAEDTMKILEKNFRFGSVICQYGLEFIIEEIDENYARMIGVEPEDRDLLKGKSIHEYIHPEDAPRIQEEVYECRRGKGSYECKYRLKMADGSYIWVWDTGEQFTKDGADYVKSAVVDIDEREKLRQQRDVTYESVPGGVAFFVIGNDNFYVREANHQYFTMLGVERKEYMESAGNYTFPEDLPGLRQHLITRAARQEMVDYEFRTRREEDGEICWYRILGNCYEVREKDVEYLCILVDVTSRKVTEFELLREKDKYRKAMKNTADLMYEYNVKHQKIHLFGRKYMTEDTVLCVDDDAKMDMRELLFESELIYKGDRKKIISFIRNEKYRYDNLRLLTKNKKTGKTYYDNYEIYCNKVYKHNKVVRILGYVRKISYKTIPVTVQQELHEIFDEHILHEYSFILKIDVPSESFTPYFVEAGDWEDYRGNRSYDSFLFWWTRNRVAPENQKEIAFFLSMEQMLRILHSGEPRGYRFCRVKGPDQKYRFMICYFSFYGPDLNTIIFTVRNVDVVRSEEQYQAKVSRDILNDALTEAKQAVEGRKAFMQYLVKELDEPVLMAKEILSSKSGKTSLKEIERCVEYLGQVVSGVEEFMNLQPLEARSENAVNLYHLCQGVCEEERKISLGLDVSIREHISIPENGWYYVHESRFKEILVNLLGNGIKYAPGGSEICLYVSEKQTTPEELTLQILLEDSGPEIDERFYERKVSGVEDKDIKDKVIAVGGIGHSISLVQKITELLGGTVTFQKGVIRNSIIQIEIPVYPAEKVAQKSSEMSIAKSSEGEHMDLHGQGVLLVENTELAKGLTAPLLQVNGAKVYAVSSGEEGLRLLNEFESGLISVILVDRELSDMSCYEFAKKARYNKKNIRRKIPVIEMLDGIQTDDTKLSLTSGVNATINKPVNVSRLTLIIESLQENAR